MYVTVARKSVQNIFFVVRNVVYGVHWTSNKKKPLKPLKI